MRLLPPGCHGYMTLRSLERLPGTVTKKLVWNRAALDGKWNNVSVLQLGLRWGRSKTVWKPYKTLAYSLKFSILNWPICVVNVYINGLKTYYKPMLEYSSIFMILLEHRVIALWNSYSQIAPRAAESGNGSKCHDFSGKWEVLGDGPNYTFSER